MSISSAAAPVTYMVRKLLQCLLYLQYQPEHLFRDSAPQSRCVFPCSCLSFASGKLHPERTVLIMEGVLSHLE